MSGKECLLLVPVLLLQSIKVLSLEEQALGILDGLNVVAKELLESWDLSNVGNHWLCHREFLLRNDSVRESVLNSFLGGKLVLKEDHLCGLASAENLRELD